LRAAGAAALALLAAAGVTAASGQDAAPPAPPGIEARADQVLTGVLGPGRASVLVVPPQEGGSGGDAAAGGARERGRADLWESIKHRMDNAPPVLPGFPVPRSLKAEALRALQSGSDPSAGRGGAAASGLTVTLTVDPSVGPAELRAAAAALAQALAIDGERGDSINIVRAPLPSGKPEAAGGGFRPDMAALGETLWRLGLILCATLALCAMALGAVRVLSVIAEVPGRRGRGLDPLPIAVRRRPQDAADFLRGRPPEDALAALRRVDPETAALLFRSMSDETRRTLAEALAAKKPVAPRRARKAVDALQEHLRAEALGGVLLEEILLRCPRRIQDAVLAHLANLRQESYFSLRRRVPTLEDLAAADRETLQKLLCAFSCEELALGLFEAPEEVRKGFLDALPSLIREMVVQTAAHLVPDSLDHPDEIRSRLFLRWRRLQRAGRVTPLLGAAPLADPPGPAAPSSA